MTMTREPQHRHHHHGDTSHERSPLVTEGGQSGIVQHMSMEGRKEQSPPRKKVPLRHSLHAAMGVANTKCGQQRASISLILSSIVSATVIVALLVISARHVQRRGTGEHPTDIIIPIENAQEASLDIGGGISLWYRTWGNRMTGIPVLFVHGGPGNSVADYHNMNANFFPSDEFFVVESDQRGTGRSQPSVWDDWRNMKHYKQITIELMSGDIEALRATLGIDKWLVFGGSWGSTLGLDYSVRFPSRVLGVILRGIFLNTRSEFDAIYTRRPFEHNPKRLSEFDTFFELAAREAKNSGEEELNPNDAERFVRLYRRMIGRGDRDAIWRWYVFENNLMEEDPVNLLDFEVIKESDFPEACGVAFFESQLFLHGTFERPVDLLRRVDRLRSGGRPVHTWICQGRRDEVCPQKYARELVDALQDAEIPVREHFIDAGHQATNPVMAACLRDRVADFAAYHRAT